MSANSAFDNLTQDDGVKALEIGDALGFEVISRAELEEVRGEGFTFSWNDWATRTAADAAVAGALAICGFTAPCALAGLAYTGYRVFEQPLYEAVYVSSMYR